jgi:hypothetical protein
LRIRFGGGSTGRDDAWEEGEPAALGHSGGNRRCCGGTDARRSGRLRASRLAGASCPPRRGILGADPGRDRSCVRDSLGDRAHAGRLVSRPGGLLRHDRDHGLTICRVIAHGSERRRVGHQALLEPPDPARQQALCCPLAHALGGAHPPTGGVGAWERTRLSRVVRARRSCSCSRQNCAGSDRRRCLARLPSLARTNAFTIWSPRTARSVWRRSDDPRRRVPSRRATPLWRAAEPALPRRAHGSVAVTSACYRRCGCRHRSYRVGPEADRGG